MYFLVHTCAVSGVGCSCHCDEQEEADATPVHPRTVQKALEILQTSHRVKVVNSVTEKSLARLQAEHSKMNAVTLLLVVAVAHFITCDNPDDGDQLPVDNWLVQLLQSYYGGIGLRVVLPTLLLAIDATTMCVRTGATASTKGWYIRSNDDDGKTRALYTVGATGPGNVQWFSVIQGMTAAGVSLPSVLVIKHVSDHSMVTQKDVHVIPIENWVRGSLGYVVFVKANAEGALKSLYDWYLQHVVLPFIKQMRSTRHGWHPHTPIPEELFACLWLDGEMSQLNSVLRDDRFEMWREALIRICKTAANSSGNCSGIVHNPSAVLLADTCMCGIVCNRSSRTMRPCQGLQTQKTGAQEYNIRRRTRQ